MNVSIDYEFNLLDYVGIVAKGCGVRRRRCGARRGRQYPRPMSKNDYNLKSNYLDKKITHGGMYIFICQNLTTFIIFLDGFSGGIIWKLLSSSILVELSNVDKVRSGIPVK